MNARLTIHRQNPAVIAKATSVFQYIVQALEAETLQGQTASKVASSAKQLVAQTGINAEQILQSLSPDGQQAVRGIFNEHSRQSPSPVQVQQPGRGMYDEYSQQSPPSPVQGQKAVGYFPGMK